ncbi:hypothetical protein FRC19_009229 [Serendipita sp. 401]|nr:hypothetical protein FRC19_009229 [Serendipita sp. 401]KAG9058451.1 hypothetical protein FS842_009519 [Serendipita sp. 407]
MALFQHLPEEILLDILVSLQIHDLLACCATCKSFQHLLKHSALLQLIVELAVQGLRLRTHINVRDDDGSSVDILNAFMRSQRAWKKIEPFKTATVPMSRVEYEICDRIFAHGLANDEDDFRGFEFNDLKINCKTVTRSILTWKRIEDTGIDILDYSFDVANDLVVIVEDPDTNMIQGPNRVFLVTISDGRPHPQAATTCFSFIEPQYWDHCDIKIVDDYLAILFREGSHFSDSEGTLMIWNWKTGAAYYDRTGIGGYAFLSPDTLFLVVAILDQHHGITAGIELLHLGKPKSDVFLALPFSKFPFEITVLSDKPTVDSPTIPKNAPLSPFVIEETTERIIVIQSEKSLLFIACRPLLRILLDESIKPTSKKPSKLPYKRVFKWHQWGPDNTLWLRMWGLWPGFTAVSGARFCSMMNSSQQLFFTNKDIADGDKKKGLPESKAKEDEDEDELDSLAVGIRSELTDTEEDEGRSILILDFNPRPILRSASKREEVGAPDNTDNGEDNWWKRFRKHTKTAKLSSEFTKLNQSKVGKLPFRAYQRPMQRRYTDMIITIDHILGIVEGETGYDVLQFVE